MFHLKILHEKYSKFIEFDIQYLKPVSSQPVAFQNNVRSTKAAQFSGMLEKLSLPSLRLNTSSYTFRKHKVIKTFIWNDKLKACKF